MDAIQKFSVEGIAVNMNGELFTDESPKNYADDNYLAKLDTPPFYAVQASAGISGFCGSIEIYGKAEVVDTDDQPIPGLYAASMAAGGVFYREHGGGLALCLASLHVANDCISCYTDETALAVQYEGATADSKMPKKLKKTSVSSNACLSCLKSWEELASSTAKPTALTDKEETTIDPHDLPAGHVSCDYCRSMYAKENASTAAVAACSRVATKTSTPATCH